MKLGIRTFLMVGLMAVVFIAALKVIVNKYSVVPEGVRSLANAV